MTRICCTHKDSKAGLGLQTDNKKNAQGNQIQSKSMVGKPYVDMNKKLRTKAKINLRKSSSSQ